MNTFGVLIGFMTLLIIGLGFVWVILGERYLSYLWWPYVILIGLVLIGVSLFIQIDWLSGLIGVIGASFLWGATELKSQAVRSELGWFKFQGKKIMPPMDKVIRKIPTPRI